MKSKFYGSFAWQCRFSLVYVGGALQLFFGLRGLRWKREIAPYESDAWACPERPKWDTSGMENYGLGPYWCPPAKNGS